MAEQELKTCVRCGGEKPITEFYKRGKAGKLTSYCKTCFGAVNLASRRKPGRKEKVAAANNEWMKQHRASNRAGVARYRAKQRELHPPWQPPASHMLIGELQQILGCTRQWANFLIDTEKFGKCERGPRRVWLIPRAAVAEYLQNRQMGQEQGADEVGE